MTNLHDGQPSMIVISHSTCKAIGVKLALELLVLVHETAWQDWELKC